MKNVIVMDNNDVNVTVTRNNNDNISQWKRHFSKFFTAKKNPNLSSTIAYPDDETMMTQQQQQQQQQSFKQMFHHHPNHHRRNRSSIAGNHRDHNHNGYHYYYYYYCCWRHDQKFRRYQLHMNNFFEIPNGKFSIIYHIMV